jgi:tetratricopeptide (TPR) repeat protein
MTVTINLFEQLLARARRHQEAGQLRSALSILRQLCTFPDVPPALLAEARERMGRIWLRRRRYRKARLYLRRALELQPTSSRHHYLLGVAWHHDPEGNSEQAAFHYQESLRLDPRQPLCLAEAGLLMIRAGDNELGLRLLRNAYDLTPGTPRVMCRLVRGLVEAGFPDEALEVARTALFQSPRNRRLREVYTELKLKLARRQQELDAVEQAKDQPPVILPFIRVVSERVDEARPVREDEACALPGPHLVRLRARQGRRRAP